MCNSKVDSVFGKRERFYGCLFLGCEIEQDKQILKALLKVIIYFYNIL